MGSWLAVHGRVSDFCDCGAFAALWWRRCGRTCAGLLIPSLIFLTSLAKKTDMALFIGQWAAPFLILGIYNKLVKIHGSDAVAGTETASI